MQQESNAKNSKLSRMSLQSIGSSFSFLKDLSKPQNAQNRESYRQSLKYCMSVQSDKKSDIYQSLIGQDVKRNNVFGSGLSKASKNQSGFTQVAGCRRSYDGKYFGSDVTNKSNLPGSHISDQNARSLLEGYQIMHVCLCSQRCERQCPCYSATNDECIMGLCCPTCIQYKINLLQTKRKLQKQGIYNLDDLKPCTCKKTKCNKKYCACYNAGRKCTNLCSCDQCTNCDFYQRQPQKQQKNQLYIDMQYEKKVQMPQKMDFEPVQFPEL